MYGCGGGVYGCGGGVYDCGCGGGGVYIGGGAGGSGLGGALLLLCLLSTMMTELQHPMFATQTAGRHWTALRTGVAGTRSVCESSKSETYIGLAELCFLISPSDAARACPHVVYRLPALCLLQQPTQPSVCCSKSGAVCTRYLVPGRTLRTVPPQAST